MNKSTSSDLQQTAGFLGGLIRQVRLGWRLFNDSRVPGWIKLIPVLGLLYLLSPLDIIPDMMLPGLGEVDDVLILILALKMLVDLSPPGVVGEHLDDLLGRQQSRYYTEEPEPDSYIEASYQVLDQNEN